MPPTSNFTINSAVAIGRWMKGAEIFMGWSPAARFELRLPRPPCRAGGDKQLSFPNLTLSRYMKQMHSCYYDMRSVHLDPSLVPATKLGAIDLDLLVAPNACRLRASGAEDRNDIVVGGNEGYAAPVRFPSVRCWQPALFRQRFQVAPHRHPHA
jgi:hypothetical protein